MCQPELSGTASCWGEKLTSSEIKLLNKKRDLLNVFSEAQTSSRGELGYVVHMISMLKAEIK